MRILLWILCLSFAASSRGELIAGLGTDGINRLFENATLVCRVNVDSVQTVREIKYEARPGHFNRDIERIATASVLDVFKGDEGSKTLKIRFTASNYRFASVAAVGDFLLLFLNGPDDTASWMWTDTVHSAFPVPIACPTGTNGSGLLKLETTLVRCLNSVDTGGVISLLHILGNMSSLLPDSVSRIETLALSSDAQIAFAAYHIVARRAIPSRPEMFEHLTDRLLLLENSNTLTPDSLAEFNPHDIEIIRDPMAFESLVRLGKSKSPSIRRAALSALRRMKDPKSVPFLITALDDEDSDVSYVALIALAENTGKTEGDYAPSKYLFDKNPDVYKGL
jgi:hypothetical protein